jgi:hypothetical protein
MIDTSQAPWPISFALCTLATWRVTHLIVEEDGPADVVLRVRLVAGSGALGKLMDCFYCTSIWVALPLAARLTREASRSASRPRIGGSRRAASSSGAVTWLALSGAACLLEQITRSDDRPALAESPNQLPADEGDATRPERALTPRAVA